MSQAENQRIQIMDILRGVAVLTIFFTNFKGGIRAADSLADQVTIWCDRLFIESSFFPLFSFLFGLGFAVQVIRAEEAGVPFFGRYLRRCVSLFLFGIAHFVLLLMAGDILRPYAVLGILLWPLRRARPPTLLTVAGVMLLIAMTARTFGGIATRAVSIVGAAQVGTTPLPTASSQAVAGTLPRPQPQPYLERVRSRSQRALAVAEYRELLINDSDPPVIFMMFVLGLYAGRRRLLSDPDANRPLLRAVFLVALLIGLTGKFMTFVMPGLTGQVVLRPSLRNPIWEAIGGPALSVAYVSGLTLFLAAKARWFKPLSPLAKVGRLALTTYLLETSVIVVLGQVWPGWRGRFGPASLAAFKFAILVGLTAFAVLWLRRFRFGPVEWLWRSVTYWRLQPLRLPKAADVGNVGL